MNERIIHCNNMFLFIAQVLLQAISLYLVSMILSGFYIHDFYTAIRVSLVLTFFNTFVRPILSFFTFPITILTLGIFSFVLNGIALLVVSNVVYGFTIDNMWTAIFGALLTSAISSILQLFVRKNNTV